MSIFWSSIQSLHESDLDRHWSRCRDELDLDCPMKVFEELFFEHYKDADFGELYRAVDWSAVDRGYQYAIDKARTRTVEEGLSDACDEVVARWASRARWLRPPILVTGEMTRTGFQYELLVGCTRLGNLLGLLDQQEQVPEMKRHRVWVGERGD